jgi:hypothetical protein
MEMDVNMEMDVEAEMCSDQTFSARRRGVFNRAERVATLALVS